jgi:hypothetical protein
MKGKNGSRKIITKTAVTITLVAVLAVIPTTALANITAEADFESTSGAATGLAERDAVVPQATALPKALSENEARCDTPEDLVAAVANPEVDTIYLTAERYALTNMLAVNRNIAFYSPRQGGATIKSLSTGRHILVMGDNVTLAFDNVILDGDKVSGGILYVRSTGAAGTLTVKGAVIKDCVSQPYGGAVKTETPSLNLNLEDCVLEGNQATGNGGGAYSFGSLTVSGCSIKGNSADRAGGGVYAVDGAIKISDSVFSGNRADKGGGVDSFEENIYIENSIFENNKADSCGGAANTERGAIIISDRVTLSGNAAPRGAALCSEGFPWEEEKDHPSHVQINGQGIRVKDNDGGSAIYAQKSF